jgi:DNA invertase Pin-like site-specific DNA recombinase
MTNSIIKPDHLRRTAYVYLRQSSPGQVRKNLEGRQRQQAMVDHVAGLGWPRSQIILLEGDTGQSGSSQHARSEFQILLQAIVTGKVGLIAARELSRLVRDNQDWSHVVRLCRFEGVLLADEHRLYDAGNAQDRMVLGIQGAFNEFELSMILDRMQESLRQKAKRGEQYDAFSPGYICRKPPLLEKHPDRRVQRAVAKVLQDFDHFSSVRQLYLHLMDERFQLLVVPHGSDWRDVQWITPSYDQILEMLRNPIYAGIYVRGRSKAFTLLDENQHKQTKYKRVPREQWDVFLENHHESYISQQQWERHVEKIADNANVRGQASKGSPGRGASLMAGLLRCRRCGSRVQARYSSRSVRYSCRGGTRQRERGVTQCLSFAGERLESQLAAEILEVVGPAGVIAAAQAAKRLAQQREQQRQLLVDRVATACEAEQRAAREYKGTDETYSAVRQALAAEWEVALDRAKGEQSRLAAFDNCQPALPTAKQREQLQCLAADVRRLWEHPRATTQLKQQLMRTLIEEIVVDVDEKRDEVVLLIQWSGGHHTELREPRACARGTLPREQLRIAVETSRKVLDDAGLAAVLNREGIYTPSGQTWTAQRVKKYRHQEGITAFNAMEKTKSGWLTQAETATRLGISPMSVHRLVRSRILAAEQRHPGLPMVICESILNDAQLKKAVAALKSGHRRPLPEDSRQIKMY